MDLNSKIRYIIEETRNILNNKYDKNTTDVNIFIKPEKEVALIDFSNESDYDEKTIKIIYMLLDRLENNQDINDFDICILNKLIRKEIDYNQINNEISKCKKSFVYFANNYLQIKNKSEEGGYFVNRNFIFGDKVKYFLYGIHEYLSDSIDKYQYVCGVKSRQIGFSTAIGAKCLHKIIFENNKTILVISKAFEEAKKTLDEQKFMYINLPFFLRRSIYKDNMSQFSLGNKYNYSSIEVKTSGKRSGRSVAATQLVLDEAEFINDVDSLWAAAAPTLSSTKGKCIVLSTPQKQKSWFYNLVNNIVEEISSEWKLVVGHWSFIPNRDSNQYSKQISLLNNDPEKIKTELEVQQILTSEHFIDYKYLTNDKKYIDIKDMLSFFDNEKNIKEKLLNFISNYNFIEFYNYPIFSFDVNNEYVEYLLSLDPYEGSNDKHGISMFKLRTYFDSSNLISFDWDIVFLGSTKEEDLIGFIFDVASIFNNLRILVERNKGYKYLSELSNQNKFSLVKEISLNKNFEYTFTEKNGLFLTEFIRKKILNLVYNYVVENSDIGIEQALLKECLGLKYKGRRVEGEYGDDIVFSVGMALIYIELIDDLIKKIRSGVNVYKRKDYTYLKNTFKCLLLGTDEQSSALDLYIDSIDKYNNEKSTNFNKNIDFFNIYNIRNKLTISSLYESFDKNSIISLFDFMNR